MDVMRFIQFHPAIKRFALFSAGVSLLACGGGLDDSRFATGSQAIANSADYKAVYAVSEDDGVIARLDVETQKVFELELGGEPARVTRNADHVFVSLRNQRSIAVLQDQNGELKLKTSISVGAEPTGIVLNEKGHRLYVAEAMSQNIREIDANSFASLRNWTVQNDPRWLALHPSGDALYVASSLKGQLTYIDLREENAVQVVELQDVENNNIGEPIAFDAPANRPDGVFVDGGALNRRFTGDPVVTPKGDLLLLPAILVDSNTPVMENEETPKEPVESGGYASNGRFNPAVMIVPVSSDGQPTHPDDVEVVAINGTVEGVSVAAYPTSVTVDPQGEVALATIEGSSTVIAMPINGNEQPRQSVLDSLFNGSDSESEDFNFGAFLSRRESYLIRTQAGPSGITFTDDNTGHIFNFLDRSVGQFNQESLNDHFSGDGDNEDEDFALFNIDFGGSENTPFTELTQSTTLFESRLPREVEFGRKLFYSSADSKMSSSDAGISCATCHFRGRNDGLTWNFGRESDDQGFEVVARQTPSLAGLVSLTAPLRWDGSRSSVAEDALMTSQGLMGGKNMKNQDAERIQDFIDWTRDIDNPNKTADQARLDNGSRVFHRPEVGCGNCHNGARATDNRTHFMASSGLSLQTRSLVGVFATSPYMHDGSQATLRDVLENAKTLGMGDTSSLSAQEFEDLLLYVSAL